MNQLGRFAIIALTLAGGASLSVKPLDAQTLSQLPSLAAGRNAPTCLVHDIEKLTLRSDYFDFLAPDCPSTARVKALRHFGACCQPPLSCQARFDAT